MISFLRGTVIEALPMRLIIEAGGVGYDVHIPLSTYDKLPQPGAEAKILTHLVVREDAHILYGFATPEEQHVNDAVLALISLGYKQAEAHKTVRAIRDAQPKATLEELVKEALKTL